MDSLAGLPDFQALVSAGQLQMYAPFGGGSYSVLPRQLVVAQGASGHPKFELALVEAADELSAIGRYAVLDLELAGDFPVDDALTRARADAADATVRPASINVGFARLYPTSNAVALPADMTAPTPLGWSGPDFVRWTTRLSIDAGELIKGALSVGATLFGARVEFDVIGVSPRLSVTVQFEPAQLIDTLLAGRQGRQIAKDDLISFLMRPVDGLPFKVSGTPDPGLFPQAMADRVVAAYGSLVPSPAPVDPPFIAFKGKDQIEIGSVSWDLRQAVAVPRQWVMTLDSLTSLRATAESGGIDGLVKYVTIPPLDLGFRSVDLAANLPSNRVGVPAIGVNIEVPANPPNRPNAISRTVTFTPPDDEGTVKFRLSPKETLSYTLAGFAVVAAGASVHEYDMPQRPLGAPWVQLQASDFPVTFAHLTATDRLLKLAKLTGALSYTVNGKVVQQPLTLSAVAPDVALALPTTASDASIALTAVPNDGGAPLSLPPMAPGRIRLDVTSFRGYGPHRLSVQCPFDAATGPLAIDLVPEERADDVTAVSTITLIPAAPSETWGYVASSPFRAGYRYRKSAASGDPPSPWSTVLSPFASLILNEDGTMITRAQS